MKIIKILLGILGLGFGEMHAQTVENPAYQKMLDILLSHSVPEQTVAEWQSKEDVILLDAREKNEYEVSHIEGARWVGYETFDAKTLKDIPKDKEILVYCSVGYRSEKVAERLILKGYQNVRNLYGGIFEWKNQGKKVVSGQGETESVHAYDRKWGVWLRKGEKVY